MLRSSTLLVSILVTVVTVITCGNSLFITIKIINKNMVFITAKNVVYG